MGWFTFGSANVEYVYLGGAERYVAALMTLLTFVVLRTLPAIGTPNEDLDPVRSCYQCGTVLLLAMLGGIQATLVVLDVPRTPRSVTASYRTAEVERTRSSPGATNDREPRSPP